jgi:hypothetical protein
MFESLRNIRTKIVDFGEALLRSTGLADKHICALLRLLHFGISLFTGYLLLFGSKKWFIFVVFINILVFTMFFLFNGCILSKLEHRFTNDEFTVIDPLLMLIGVELTNDNRYKYSLFSNIFASLFTFGLYWVRFGKKHGPIHINYEPIHIKYDKKNFDENMVTDL